MIKLISYGELSRINPEWLYHLYRQVSLTLNTTRAGSLENIEHALNLHYTSKWQTRIE